MMLRGISRKNRKAIKLLKENGFEIDEKVTKLYWEETKSIFFHTPSDSWKIFGVLPDKLETYEKYGISKYGLWAVPYDGKDVDMSFIKID